MGGSNCSETNTKISINIWRHCVREKDQNRAGHFHRALQFSLARQNKLQEVELEETKNII